MMLHIDSHHCLFADINEIHKDAREKCPGCELLCHVEEHRLQFICAEVLSPIGQIILYSRHVVSILTSSNSDVDSYVMSLGVRSCRAFLDNLFHLVSVIMAVFWIRRMPHT